MATSFPTSKDILINPDGVDSVKEVSHSAQHANANDAIVALETKVGVDNSTDANSLDYKVKQLELNFQDENEIKDLAASIITGGSHTGITVSYNNTTNLLNLTATYDDAEVVTAVATALTAGNGITKTYVTAPPNYLGDYNNGYSYALNDVVSIPVGSPYGIVGSYFIRSGNPGNPGYPPEPGGATNASWTLYAFSNKITVGVDTTVIADRTYVNNAISNLVEGAPALLDTLNEIAAAIGDDSNFVTTITTALATKAPLASPDLTGIPTAPTAAPDTNSTQIATTSFAKTEADAAQSAAAIDATDKVAAEAALRVTGDATSVATAAADATAKANAARAAAELTGTNTFVPIAGFAELAQDSVSSLLAHAGHTNVTATYDDVANKINLAVTAQLTQEEAQDYIAPLFVHGLNPNVNATYDDISNKLILEAVIPPSTAIVSAGAPANPINGQFWFDSDEFRTGSTRALKVWQSSTSSWQYVASDLSLSTSNTWTSTNTFTNGIVIALDSNPLIGVHGQIYYNRVSDKLKVYASGLWQDVQVGEGGGGLSLISTDNTLPPTTFFVGLIAPPTQSTSSGDLWIDVDDIDTPFNQFYTGGVSPDPAQYEFWVDNVEPIQELIYSADEPGTPSYPGELWIDTDEFDGAIVEFGATPPNPNNVQLWVDVNENESPSYYDQLTFTNYATVANFPQNAPNGFVASDASTGLAYVRSQGQWLAIVTASNINNIISSNSTVFEDLKALAWMGFE